MAYGGRGGDFGGSSSGFWGRLQNEANTRLQKTTSRMEEVAREMARRQAEAEQRRREEEERRRQQEAERQRREAEQRADEQKRQAEEQSRMRLLEDQKRNEQAQAERGKLVLASLNQQDHENYRNALNSDQMLQQATWERDQAARMGDTQEAERVNAWINDRKNLIRGNVIPATRTTKTLAEYQAEWNNDADRLAEERAKKQEEARSLQSREGLSRYMAAKEKADKAQAEADRAKKWITEQDDDGARVMAEARELAQRMGYREDQLPGTVEEMAALDPGIAENEQVKQYLDNKAFVKENAVKAKETADTATQDMKDARANEDVTTGDWGDLDRFNRNKWGGQVFNPIGYTKDGLDLQMSQISSGIDLNAYNDPQRTLARKVYDEVKRRYDIISDPKKALADLDEEIAWLEGLSGAYWDERGSEISDRLAKARAQRTLIMAAAMSGETNFKQRSENGYNAWHDAEGRTTADMLNVDLTGGKNESSVQRQNVIAGTGIGQNWAADQANQLSDEGQKILFLTDQEKAAYFALYNDSPEKAGEFLDAMSDEISQRRAAKREEVYRDEAEKLPVLTDVMSSVVEVAKPLTAMGTLVQDVLSGKVNADDSAFIPDAYQQAVRGLRHEQLKDKPWASFLYDVGTQIGDNLSRAYGSVLMGIGNSKITTGAMAFGAAGSTYRELRSQGYDQDQAALASGIAGFAEYITEKWSDAEWFKGIEEGYTGFKNLMKSAIQSAGQEGWTEVASDLISLAGEKVALGDDNSYNRKIKDYYYETGDMEEARRLAFQDQLGQELYTFALSALSGAGMEVANRSAAGIWKKYRDNKKKEVSGEGDSTQADTARDSYGTQDGAEAAAEGAMPQYSSEELDEALMAAAAPMTAQEQQTDAVMAGQETADAVTAEADAQRAAEAAQIRKNDNVSRLAREIAAGEVAQGVEDMPVERRSADSITEEIDGLLNENDAQTAQIDEMKAAADAEQDQGARQDILDRVQAMQAEQLERWNRINELRDERRTISGLPMAEQRTEPKAVSVPAAARGDRVAGVEDMPMERRQAVIENAEPGTAAERVNTVKGLSYETAAALSNPKAKQFAENWVAKDADDSEVMKQATLAAIRGNTDEGEAGSIQDDTQWHEAAGAVYDEIYGKYGKALASGDGDIWQRAQDYADGKIETIGEVLAGINDPLLSAFSRDEAGALMRGAATEYKRHAGEVTGRAREAASKYGFKAEGENGTGNGVVLRTVEKDLTPEQVTQLRVIDRFAKQLKADGMPGLDINVFGSLKNTAGQAVNGSYSTDGSVKDAASINVSLDAEGGNILRAAGHELYHMVETWGKAQAEKIKGFVLNALEATEGYDLDERRAELKEIYSEDTDVDSEIVADSMFEVLGSEENITAVMKEQPKLGARIVEFVKRIGASLKRATERIANLGSKEAKALKDQTGVLDTIREMWENGVKTAQKNIQAARVAENTENYSVAAVAEADGTEARAMALDNVADELVTKTQGAMLTADTDRRTVRNRLNQALIEYGRGQKSLAAALEDHGLQNITDTEDRSVAAWYAREMAEPVTITKSDRLSVQSIEKTFRSIWNQDETETDTTQTKPMAERALDLLYDINDKANRKESWVSRLSQFVDTITEGNGNADKNKVKDMLTLLYSAFDKENRVYTPNAARYAGMIADEIGTVGLETAEQADPGLTEDLRDTMAERIILNYFDLPQANDRTQRAVTAMQGRNNESMKALRDEVWMLRQAVDYQEAQLTDMQRDVARADRRTEVIGNRIERMKERERVEKTRRSVEQKLGRMKQWLLSPNKAEGKHVVEHMKGAVAQALSMVNTGSPTDSESRRSIDYANLIASIQSVKDGEMGLNANVDPDLIPRLEELRQSAADKMFMEMNSEELENLDKALTAIYTMIKNANELFTAKNKARVDAVSRGMVNALAQKDDLKTHRKGVQTALNFVNWTMMDSQRYFDNMERMAGPGGKMLYDILRKGGLDKQIELTEDLKEQFKQFEQWDYKNWAAGRNQKATTFDVYGGQQITLTDAQIMSLYLLMRRPQAANHILKGGIQATPIDVKGKVVRQTTPVIVSIDDVQKIIGTLSDEQRACADALQKIVGGWGSKLGNETSMMLYGYKKFGEEHYFPIKVVSDVLGVKGTEFEENQKAANLYAIINKGFTKELKPKAANAIMLGNAFDVGLDHLAGMIAYRSWGPALMDATRILNYKQVDEDGNVIGDTLVHQINRTMGSEATNWMMQLLKDINGLAKDPIESETAGFTRMFRNFKAAAVGFNISTILKQGLSIVRAFDVIPSYYFPTGRQLTERFKTEGEGKDKARTVDNLMNKYAPIYAWKQDGRFTMDTGKDLRSIMLPKTETFANKFTEFGMKGAGAADNMTWHTIWFAAENMIAKTRKDLTVGSDAFYQAVGEKFTECVDNTQVVDSIMHRAKVMRSNAMWIKLATSFMGEPLKTFNQAADAIRAFAEDKSVANGKKLAKTSMVLVSSAVLQATIASIISGFRKWNDDEPLEETIRKYLLGEYDEEKGLMNNAVEFLFGNNLAGEINPINYIPLVRDFADVAQGHDVVRDDMQMLTNLWKKMSALTNDSGKTSTAKKIVELGSAIADLFGVPASNIFKEIDYVSNWGSRALEQAGMSTEAVQYIRLMYNRALGKPTNQAEYAKYMLNLEEAEKGGRVEHEFVERVRKDLGGAYDPAKFEKKVAALQLERLTGDTDLEGSLAKYEALIKAMDSGDRQKEKEIRDALARNGTTDDTINKNVRTVRMMPYTEGTTIDEFYDEYVKRMKSGDKKAAASIGKILADSYKSKPENHTNAVKNALARDQDFMQAETARYNNGDTDAHVNLIKKYEQMGFDHDLLIAACNLAYDRAKDAANEQNGQAKTNTTTPKTYGDSYGFTGADLSAAFLDNSDSFWDVLEDLRKQGKTDESIKSSLTGEVKKVYLELKSTNPAAADDLRHRLLALGLGYTERQIRGWK